MSSSIRRPILVLLVLVGIIIILSLAALVVSRDDEPDTAAVERGSLDVTIETSGRLVARDPAVVRSEVGGRAEVVGVQVGDEVEAGDVLVVLESEPFEKAIQQAEEQLRNAETMLNLAEQNGGEDPSSSQMAEQLTAEQRVRDAERVLEQARERLASSLITTPVAGTIIELQAASGAPVGDGAVIAQITDLRDLELNVEIDEIDLPRLETGTSVTFTLDAYPGQEIEGTLTRIAPTAQTSGGTTTFPGTITFTLPDEMMVRPGMNASVMIQTAVRDDVLLIPERALRTVGQRTFVTVVENGSTEEKEIQTGLRSQGQVEVASGLSEGDRVELR